MNVRYVVHLWGTIYVWVPDGLSFGKVSLLQAWQLLTYKFEKVTTHHPKKCDVHCAYQRKKIIHIEYVYWHKYIDPYRQSNTTQATLDALCVTVFWLQNAFRINPADRKTTNLGQNTYGVTSAEGYPLTCIINKVNALCDRSIFMWHMWVFFSARHEMIPTIVSKKIKSCQNR